MNEQNSQVLVALGIVVAMTVLGGGLLAYAWHAKDGTAAVGGVMAIIGALATALNAPTGVSAALAASKKTPPPAEPPPPSPQP